MTWGDPMKQCETVNGVSPCPDAATCRVEANILKGPILCCAECALAWKSLAWEPQHEFRITPLTEEVPSCP